MERFPTLTDLLTAFVATVAAALAAIPIYNDNLNQYISIPGFVWAPVWAMSICSLNTRVVISDAVRSSIGAGCGAGCGLFVHWLASFITTDMYPQYAISTVLLIPFSLLFMSSHPDCKLPTSRVIRWDVALICMYLVGSFGRGKSPKLAWSTSIGFTYGSLCSVACVLIFRPVFLFMQKKQGLQYALSSFRASHTHWFEGLSAYLVCPSSDHDSELKQREIEASQCLRNLLTAIKFDSQNPFRLYQEPKLLLALNHAALNIHAQLLAIRGTITREGYVQENSLLLYSHVGEKLGELRIRIVVSLRSAKPLSDELSDEVFACLCEGYAKADDGLEEDDEMNRMVFAIDAFVRLAKLVNAFHCVTEKPMYKYSVLTSIFAHWREIFNNLNTIEKYRNIHRKAYIFRASLGQQILAQSLIGFQMGFSHLNIVPYFGWSIVGFLICFLPTLGQAVIRGSRRFLGTLAGSTVAAISAVRSMTFAQMIIIVFAGKLASFHPYIQYGGIVFALAWMFECTPGTALSPDDELLEVVKYRTICMCVGVGFSFVCSCVLFPVFSTSGMLVTLTTTLKAVAQIAGESFDAVTNPQRKDSDDSVRSQTLVRLHTTYSALASLCAESSAEMFVTARRIKKPFMIKNIIAAESAIYRLANCVYSLASTLSANRVSPEGYAVYFDTDTVGIFNELKKDIESKINLLVTMLMTPNQGNVRNCDLLWDHRITALRNKLEKCNPADSVCLHVMIFELVECFSAYDAVLNAMDPSQLFSSVYSKSGIMKSSGVRFSVIMQ